MASHAFYLQKYDSISYNRLYVNSVGFPMHSLFQFQTNGASDTFARGLTWDGRCIQVCTSSQIASAANSTILACDPDRHGTAGGFITADTVITNIPLGDDLEDIVWNGKGYYGLVYDSSVPVRYIVELDPRGQVIRTVVTPVSATARAIAYDGGDIIYISYMSGANPYLAMYDVMTGNQINTGAIIAVSQSALIPPVTAPGIAFNGKDLIFRVVDDETAAVSAHDIELMDIGFISPWNFANSNFIRTGIAGFAYERAPLAWDGAYAWTLCADTA